jgi:type II secretory pathway pseudopilin PulG
VQIFKAKRKNSMKNTKKSFTLVELLCATALVVILAGIGFSAYSYASHRGKEAATKSLITRIAAGLETLKTKHGFYPASSGYGTIEVTVNNNTGLITAISFGGTSVSDAKQLKDFLAVADGENLKKYVADPNGTSPLTDAWGGKIQYRYPGSINTVKFDIVAPGADEGFGTAAAGTPPATLSSYQTNGEWACDDIANFQ